jgi:nucleotidyltransferase/DNA polymerase involved in DNA repair
MFGLCDCNNFFVTCERVFDPSLNNRPVVVHSNNDGCVVSHSNEAKAIGIKMGQPLYQIRDLVKRHNIAVRSSNYHLYGDMSKRVMATLKQHIPFIEIYSIDEAFLQLDGIPAERLKAFGEEVAYRKALGEETGKYFDNAFRFLEETFGQSQELVIFVTEITSGHDTSWFVENFGCDAYFRHNKNLLFDDTRHRIREQISAAKATAWEETTNG